jgi:hypothetical protein
MAHSGPRRARRKAAGDVVTHCYTRSTKRYEPFLRGNIALTKRAQSPPYGHRTGSRLHIEETATMKKFVLLSALAGTLSLTAIAEASAWTRSASSNGPRGTSSLYVSGGCANGTCSRTATRTGPAGNTYTRQGTVSRY